MADLQNKINQWMENPIVVGLLAIGITMYGPRLSPKLPDFIRSAFNSGLFRFLIILLVIFVGFRSIRLAIVIAVLFLMIVSIANQQSIKEDFNKQVREYYANYNLFKLGNIEHFENGSNKYKDWQLVGSSSIGNKVKSLNYEDSQTGEKKNFEAVLNQWKESDENIENDYMNKPLITDQELIKKLNADFDARNNEMKQDLNFDNNMNGNDVQNDNQGLYDYDEEDSDNAQNKGSSVFISDGLKPVVDFVNNPKLGVSSKCRSYWNSIADDSQGCIQELEVKTRENPELLKELNAKMSGSNGVNMGDKIKNIEKKISDACAAFRGSA